jgi:hypothetical protein
MVARCIVLTLLATACNRTQVPVRPAETAPKVPQVRATVINLRTTIGPSNKIFTHFVVIANGKARSAEELDRWRLFDLASGSVTFVDDLSKSFRTESLTALIDVRSSADESDGSKLAATGARKLVNGVEASQYVLSRGAYRRELWLATIPNVPPQLFAMMQASRRPSGAENQKTWTEAPLAGVRGYPMDDHAQLPYGASSLSIDRTVTSVEQKDMPAALLLVPDGYRDVTVKPAARAPGERPPADGSPLPDRRAPGAG